MAYHNAILAETGLLAYFRLAESSGTTAFDMAKYLEGEIKGGFSLCQGGPGYLGASRSLLLNGKTGHVLADLLCPQKEISLECWCRPWTRLKNTSLVYLGGDKEESCSLSIGDDGCFSFSLHFEKETVEVPGFTFPGLGWYYLLGTYDGKEARLYVQGQLEAGATASGLLKSGDCLLLGASEKTRPKNFFEGCLSEVAVYEACLSKESALLHYDSAFSTSPSGVAKGRGRRCRGSGYAS